MLGRSATPGRLPEFSRSATPGRLAGRAEGRLPTPVCASGGLVPALGPDTPALGRDTPALGRDTPALGRDTSAAGRGVLNEGVRPAAGRLAPPAPPEIPARPAPPPPPALPPPRSPPMPANASAGRNDPTTTNTVITLNILMGSSFQRTSAAPLRLTWAWVVCGRWELPPRPG